MAQLYRVVFLACTAANSNIFVTFTLPEVSCHFVMTYIQIWLKINSAVNIKNCL